jgi:hypothetical protein
MTSVDFAAMYKNARKSSNQQRVLKPAVEPRLSLNHIRDLDGSGSLLFSSTVLSPENLVSLLDTIKSLGVGWNAVNGREVMLFGGVPHPDGAILDRFPQWLSVLATDLAPYFGGTTPNQVLLNRYLPGQGIGYHQDGPLYESVAAILSVNNSAVLKFREGGTRTSRNDSEAEPTEDDCGQPAVFLPGSSLLIFSNTWYDDCAHSVAACLSDEITSSVLNAGVCGMQVGQKVNRDPCYRYSLTFRVVKSVSVKLEEFGPCNTEMREEICRRQAWWLSSISQ